MFRRNFLAVIAFAVATFAVPTFGQTTSTPDLSKFVPGRWMSESGKAGVELESVKDGVVTGKWFDVTGITYPIGATWIKGKTASGRFEKGVFHMTVPTGNKFDLNLSPDGSVLSGSRQIVDSSSYQPTQTSITFKRN